MSIAYRVALAGRRYLGWCAHDVAPFVDEAMSEGRLCSIWLSVGDAGQLLHCVDPLTDLTLNIAFDK